MAEIYLKENKYIIEDILAYDDTNKDIQKNYLNLAIKALNSNHKIDNICGKTTKYKNFISEYKKRNNDNLSDKIPKINKKARNGYKTCIIDI